MRFDVLRDDMQRDRPAARPRMSAYGWLVGLIAIAASLLIHAPAHAAADRVALVIGNSNYVNAVKLANPANDATDIAAALRNLGFDVVEGRDLDRRGMEDKVREFGRKLDRATLALFFYAGHGMQVNGKNYLVPIDSKLERSGELNFETLDLSLVLTQMETEKRVNLVFLDACRDNPLSRSFARNNASRSTNVGQGLASVQSAVGTMIAYATQPDNVALDGTGRNSPFTTALLKHIATPGLEIRSMMTRVRADVLAATHDKQLPWDHSSLIGEVVLSPQTAKLNSDVALAPQSGVGGGIDEFTWSLLKASKDPDQLRRFIQQFPQSTYRAEAVSRIFMLEQGKGAAPADIPDSLRPTTATGTTAAPSTGAASNAATAPSAPMQQAALAPQAPIAQQQPPRESNIRVTMSGAPGDGNSALPRALRVMLAKDGFNAARYPGYSINAQVEVGPVADGKQPISIKWQVKDGTGKSLGTINQRNSIPAHSLDGTWGVTADAAATAASAGVMRLLSDSGTKRVATQPVAKRPANAVPTAQPVATRPVAPPPKQRF